MDLFYKSRVLRDNNSIPFDLLQCSTSLARNSKISNLHVADGWVSSIVKVSNICIAFQLYFFASFKSTEIELLTRLYILLLFLLHDRLSYTRAASNPTKWIERKKCTIHRDEVYIWGEGKSIERSTDEHKTRENRRKKYKKDKRKEMKHHKTSETWLLFVMYI